MKKVVNISVKILLIFMVCITLFCTFGDDFIYAVDNFNTNDWAPSTSVNEEDSKLLEIGNKIIGPIQLIGSLVSVITIIIIGIRYMLGSIEEKAQYKETLVPYFLGAVFVFGITNVLSIVYDIAISLNKF